MKNKYTEYDIFNMLEFLVDKILVVFGGGFSKQVVCNIQSSPAYGVVIS